MSQVRGLVQGTKLLSGTFGYYWVYIGPTPTNVGVFTLLLIEEEVDDLPFEYRNRMAGDISGALFARREVIIQLEDNDSRIIGVEVVPG